MKKYTEEVNEIYEEKYSKKFIINKNYHAQIAEMEFMVKDDESHRESITIIIENLQEDMQSEFKKVEEEYAKILEEKERKFLKETIRSNNSLQVIEEKFKMEMLGSINDIIYPKK